MPRHYSLASILAVLLGVFAFASSAFAVIAGDVPKAPYYTWSGETYSDCVGLSSPDAAAACVVPHIEAECDTGGATQCKVDSLSPCVLKSTGTSATCDRHMIWLNPNGTWGGNYSYITTGRSSSIAGYSCPANSTQDSTGACHCDGATSPDATGTSCVADAGKNADGSSHDAWPNGCKVGSESSWDGDVQSSSSTMDGALAPACVGGCVAQPFGAYQKSDGTIWVGSYGAVGGTCNVGAAGPPAPVDPSSKNTASCQPVNGAAMCGGQVNGQWVCVACGSASATQNVSQTTTTNASGGTSSSTSKTTVTDNHDGTVTTTTTVTSSDGSSSTSTSTQPKTPAGAQQPNSFCTDNPQSPICKTSSFGGSCSGSFSCDGDAIQCAIVREQHERNCAFFEPSGRDEGDKYTTAKNDGDQPSWSPASPQNQAVSQIDLSTRLDQSNPFGSSCLQDEQISLGGVPVTLPWSQFCTSMQLAGRLIVAAAFLMCAFIVFKS